MTNQATKIVGLKKIAGESKKLNGPYGSYHLDVFYDTKTGKAWASAQIGNSYCVYDDANIVRICSLHEPRTMAEIKRTIIEVLDEKFS